MHQRVPLSVLLMSVECAFEIPECLKGLKPSSVMNNNVIVPGI